MGFMTGGGGRDAWLVWGRALVRAPPRGRERRRVVADAVVENGFAKKVEERAAEVGVSRASGR